METIAFYIIAVLSVVAFVIAILKKNLILCVKWFGVGLLILSGDMILLDAPYVAIFHVLVVCGLVSSMCFLMAKHGHEKRVQSKKIINFMKSFGVLAISCLGIIFLLVIMRPPFEAAPFNGELYSSSTALAEIILGGRFLTFSFLSLGLVVAVFIVSTLLKKEDA